MSGFTFGYRFPRRSGSDKGSATGGGPILYGPNYGPRGPKRFLVSVWNQRPVGYCYETDNLAEDLYAKWAARGVNTVKHQHPDFVVGGEAAVMLAAAQAKGLMLLAAPRWSASWGDRPSAEDYRSLAMTDSYWRTNWIGYAHLDEPDLNAIAQSVHEAHFAGHALGGVTKPGVVNFTWRIGNYQTLTGTGSTVWRDYVQSGTVQEITHDTYSWHLEASDLNDSGGTRESGGYHQSAWNGYGPYNSALDPSIRYTSGFTINRRFTASRVGLNVHIARNGPLAGPTDPLPTALSYAPGEKPVGHYVATGRVDFGSPTFARGGRHAPSRFLRDDVWSGVVHGSSHVLIFPQAPGFRQVTGYVDAATQRLIVTDAPARPSGGLPNINGAMSVVRKDTGAGVGFIRRDNPQVSGTPYAAGTYALDPAKLTPVNAGSAGTPIQFYLYSAESVWADGTDAANASELTTATANLARMQAHPTGGNLLIDTTNGGRRAFTVLRCPDIPQSPRTTKEDMTLAPIQAGYLPDGTPVADSAGNGPGWLFGWPMGFEGFHVTGDDGAVYIYVKSMSCGNAPTWFPGYAALGLPARVFGPFELVGFRRVGTGSAVEMTGSSAVLKAGADDGAATHFYIETAGYAQAEGTGAGTTTFTIRVRRGGNTSGSNTVTATVAGTGVSPANAADFTGGTFPSEVLSFAAGETFKDFAFTVSRDSAGEVDETFAVTLSAPSGGAALVGSGKSAVTCTITNDDAAVVGAFLWLGGTLTGAPALSGAPAGASYVNVTETSFVTRAGVKVASLGGGPPAYDSGLFANVPGWTVGNSFQGAIFEIPAGNWEFAIIAASASFGGGVSGTVTIHDDPYGANTLRQSLALSQTGTCLVDTDNTAFTSGTTALADAVNNLTFVPVTVSTLYSGLGVVKVSANGVTIAAIALRQV